VHWSHCLEQSVVLRINSMVDKLTKSSFCLSMRRLKPSCVHAKRVFSRDKTAGERRVGSAPGRRQNGPGCPSTAAPSAIPGPVSSVGYTWRINLLAAGGDTFQS
jgi:hypothetical protein